MGIETLIAGMPGTVAQGIIYGIMALGIFITFKLLNFADLSVDGSFATGGAVAAMVIVSGRSWVLALVLAFVAGAAASKLREIARESGFKTLWEIGMSAVQSGLTSPDELARVAGED